MTINPSNTRQLNIDAIVLQGAQRSGVFSMHQGVTSPQWDAVGTYGRNALDSFTKSVQARGIFERTMELYPLAITANTNPFTMPSDTINVVDEGTMLRSTSTAGTPVRRISREEYLAIPDKTIVGLPSRYYLERGETVKVFFDLVPADAGTFTVQRYRLYADANTGSYTPDMETYWTEVLVFKAAYEIAMGSQMPVPRCVMLKSDFKDALEAAMNYARPDTNSQMSVEHTTPWSS